MQTENHQLDKRQNVSPEKNRSVWPDSTLLDPNRINDLAPARRRVLNPDTEQSVLPFRLLFSPSGSDSFWHQPGGVTEAVVTSPAATEPPWWGENPVAMATMPLSMLLMAVSSIIGLRKWQEEKKKTSLDWDERSDSDLTDKTTWWWVYFSFYSVIGLFCLFVLKVTCYGGRRNKLGSICGRNKTD